MKASPDIQKFLEGVTGIVEANSFEKMCLWERYHQDKGMRWEEKLSGYLVTVGKVGKRPVCISVLTDTVDGVKILFWHATSQVIDHAQIEAWLEENLPEAWSNKADAMNFSNVLRRTA